MSLKIGVLMDAIETIKPYKDSTFAMMLAAQAKGHELFYFQQHDLFVQQGVVYTEAQAIRVKDHSADYYQLAEKRTIPLTDLHAVLMRKDPPFNMEFVYTTYLLEMAEKQGTLIVNPPNALRSVNEKFYINYFPELTPKTLVTRNIDKIRQFIEEEQRAVVKPMDGMGGMGIFKVHRDDANTNAILESLGNGAQTLMVQVYLDKGTAGDKRILLVDGQPPKYGLARIPQGQDFRANLAAGGRGEVQALSPRERQLCERVRPWIQTMDLLFVGLDVIDGHITEINVTSPTCIREIQQATGEDIAERLMLAIESRCNSTKG